MRPASVSTLAVLLVAAAVGMPAVAATQAPDTGTASAPDTPAVERGSLPAVVAVPNYVNHLSVPDEQVRTSGFGTASLDIGTAIAADRSGLRTQFTLNEFDRAFADANSSAERTEVTQEFATTATTHTQRLQRERFQIVRAYANGSMSTSAFFRSLSLVGTEARELRLAISSVQGSLQSPPDSLDTRLENLEGRLEVLNGPLADQITQAAFDSNAARTVYVETSDSGYTLAMVNDDTYVRETYLATARNANGTDLFAQEQLRVNAANRRGAELYPWATNNSSPAGQALGSTGIYRFRVDHNNGELTAYLDGNTTDAFREHQRQSISAVPVTDTLVETNGTLAVVVNRTYATGPMNVSVSRTTTGEPIAGTVFINGQRVGSTGPDGALWTVEPRAGVPLTVRTEDGERVRVRIPA